MKIRKYTKKMILHKVRYFQAKKGKVFKKGAQAYHHQRFLHFKNLFHNNVSVA